MKHKYFFILFLFFMISCTSTGYMTSPYYEKGTIAEVNISKNFDKVKHKSLAVLPFVNSGKEGFDFSISDKFTTRLMGLGFTVIERTQIESVFNELGLQLSGSLSKEDYHKIGQILNIDMLVTGTMAYTYMPSVSMVGQNVAASIEANYALNSESLRFIEISSGEVIISAYCRNFNPEKSISDEIYYSLERKLTSQ